MPTKEELQKLHNEGQSGINKPIKGFFIEHFSTKRDFERQAAWNKGKANREPPRSK
jgi:hypothetical protein